MGNLVDAVCNNLNMWVSSQGITQHAWKLPGREIVGTNVYTLYLPHVDRRVKTFTPSSLRYI